MISEIANEIIEYCLENKVEISNLKLQKLLFFYQKEYYKLNRTLAFEDEFLAFKYGPVNYEIWKKYQNEIYYTKSSKTHEVKKYLKAYLKKNNTYLVNLSHESVEWKIKSNEKFSVMDYKSLIGEWNV